MIKIKTLLRSSYAKCLYFAFCLNAISALLASAGNNNGDGDSATGMAIIGLVVFYLLSPVIVFIYGMIRQAKYKTDHKIILSGIIIALTAAFVFPIFLWIGSGALPIQNNPIRELLLISEYIPIKQFIAFLLGCVSVKLFQTIIQNRK